MFLTALQLLRDKYGANIQYLNIDVADKYNVLENSIHAGDTVDMFPYDPSLFPQGLQETGLNRLIITMISSIWKILCGTKCVLLSKLFPITARIM